MQEQLPTSPRMGEGRAMQEQLPTSPRMGEGRAMQEQLPRSDSFVTQSRRLDTILLMLLGLSSQHR